MKVGFDLSALQEVLHVSSAQSFVMDHWLERFKRPNDTIAVRRRRTEVLDKSLCRRLVSPATLAYPSVELR